MLGQRNGDISTSKAGRSCTEKFDGYQLQADKTTFYLRRCSIKLGWSLGLMQTKMFENNFILSHNSYPVSWG